MIGVGKMGQAHLRALTALGVDALAGWAPSDRRRDAVVACGAAFVDGPLVETLRAFAPTHVVVASPIETLASTAIAVLDAGVRAVLVEKPAALSAGEGDRLAVAAAAAGARIRVGYNRRFYGSVRTAFARMRRHGERVDSVLFEFNETLDAAGPSGHAPVVAARWVLGNSLHVIDTAFLPSGRPDRSRSAFAVAGALPWHPAASIFSGSGITVENVPFAYHANWSGPGRWAVEWVTRSERYILRPMEQLQVLARGRSAAEAVASSDDFDERFKPGVYLQDQAFLDGDDRTLPDLQDACDLLRLGETIAAYPTKNGYDRADSAATPA